MAGGWASGRLIGRGASAVGARLSVMLACALLAPASALVPSAPMPGLALSMAMVVVFAHLAWLINLTAMVVDLVPGPAVATVFGVIAAGSAAGGIAMNELVGRLVSHSSYRFAFVVMAFVHPIAWLILRPIGRRRTLGAGMNEA